MRNGSELRGWRAWTSRRGTACLCGYVRAWPGGPCMNPGGRAACRYVTVPVSWHTRRMMATDRVIGWGMMLAGWMVSPLVRVAALVPFGVVLRPVLWLRTTLLAWIGW
jgi:hypothetical protein